MELHHSPVYALKLSCYLYYLTPPKHYAHRPLKDAHLIWNLFQQTDKEELSETLDFLCDLKAAIWQLYYNGKKPNLDESSHEDDAEAIRESVRSVLNKLTQASAAG